MTELLAVDYAWTHPAPGIIKAAGYFGVLRYLSLDPTKDLSAAEAQQLLAFGLWILLVWETGGNRALADSGAGVADAMQANAIADQLGYPDTCPLFVAVDTDATWAQVAPYFQGWDGTSKREVLPYGGIKIIDGFFGVYGRAGWQTVAWSGGRISPNAALFQRLTPTLAPIGGSYDEDEILQPLSWWGAPTPKEDEVALVTLTKGDAPFDIPSDPAAAESYRVTFDALADGLPTTNVRLAAHKADGSDAWVQPRVTIGTNPAALPYNADGTVTVTKGWPVTIVKDIGVDNLSLTNEGEYPIQVRV